MSDAPKRDHAKEHLDNALGMIESHSEADRNRMQSQLLASLATSVYELRTWAGALYELNAHPQQLVTNPDASTPVTPQCPCCGSSDPHEQRYVWTGVLNEPMLAEDTFLCSHDWHRGGTVATSPPEPVSTEITDFDHQDACPVRHHEFDYCALLRHDDTLHLFRLPNGVLFPVVVGGGEAVLKDGGIAVEPSAQITCPECGSADPEVRRSVEADPAGYASSRLRPCDDPWHTA